MRGFRVSEFGGRNAPAPFGILTGGGHSCPPDSYPIRNMYAYRIFPVVFKGTAQIWFFLTSLRNLDKSYKPFILLFLFNNLNGFT